MATTATYEKVRSVPRNELASFLLLCAVVAINQSFDLLPPFVSEYTAVPYLVYFMIDVGAFVLLLVISDWHRTLKLYAFLLLLIQTVSLTNHSVMLSVNGLYSLSGQETEIFAVIHDYYKPALRMAFYSKVAVLLWGGYGVLNRFMGNNSVSVGYGSLYPVRDLLRAANKRRRS